MLDVLCKLNDTLPDENLEAVAEEMYQTRPPQSHRVKVDVRTAGNVQAVEDLKVFEVVLPKLCKLQCGVVS